MKTMMNGESYRYSGPLSGVTLQDGREVMLNPDTIVHLPSEHPYVQTLLTLGYLSVEKVRVEPVNKLNEEFKNTKKGA